jgi:hypothetical protein
MKRLLLAVVLGALAVGCSNDCDDAVDKLEECGADVSGADTDDCDGASECVAGCINDASCEEIKSTDINGKYFKCVAACGS